IPKNEWVKISSSDVITKSAVDSHSYVRICLEGNGTFEVYFRKIQLEKGTKATDWSPAPEDPIEGDRLIINKDKLITGNISAPSATFLDLTAEKITVLDSTIKDSTITGTLHGNNAIIENFTADSATIKKSTIDSAKITGTLDGRSATIKDFIADNANIINSTVKSAKVTGTLDAKDAIFQRGTFRNIIAENATIDSATIKGTLTGS